MLELPLSQLLTSFVSTVLSAIEQGNTLHDSRTNAYGQAVNYGFDEAVVALKGTVAVCVVDGDLPASFPPFVPHEMTLCFQLQRLSLSNSPRYAVFVSNTEKPYLLVVANGSVLLVDTHRHGKQHGALIASGSIEWMCRLFLEQGLAAYTTLSVVEFV